MTGQELIDFINANNAQNYEVHICIDTEKDMPSLVGYPSTDTINVVDTRKILEIC